MTSHVAQASTERGEIVLLRRGGALELRVNGVFVMDTVHTETERLLASRSLASVSGADLRVLIGGLGLGFTLGEVLADPRVRVAEVAEIEPDLVAWHRQGLVPETEEALRDARTRITVGDVADVLRDRDGGPYDLILLDVDNGPGYLVYERNAAIYGARFLELCRDNLTERGVVAVWSASREAALEQTMTGVFGDCQEVAIPVRLGQRETTYYLYCSAR